MQCNRLQAMREGEIRIREQRARAGAPLIEENARRVPACMPPNHLAALGPRGEQTHWPRGVIST